MRSTARARGDQPSSLLLSAQHSYLFALSRYQRGVHGLAMPTPEAEILKPADPSITDSDDWETFVLHDARVVYESNGKLANLLSAYADTPLRVEGRLEAPDRTQAKCRTSTRMALSQPLTSYSGQEAIQTHGYCGIECDALLLRRDG
jgi:hypothetical protein